MAEAVQEASPEENRQEVEAINSVKGVLESASSPEAEVFMSEAEVIQALSKLEALGSLPKSVLRETMVGKSVNNLVKYGEWPDSIQNRARALVASWKSDVQSNKRKSSGNSDEPQKLQRLASGDSKSVGSQQSPKKSVSLSEFGGDDPKTQERRKMVTEKIIDALGKQEQIETKEGDDNEETQMRDFYKLAREIEKGVYEKFYIKRKKKKKDHDGDEYGEPLPDEIGYMNQVRTFLHNLKDSKNATFRFKVSVGFFKPSDIADLSAEQMASNEKNEQRKKLRQAGMAEIDSGSAMKQQSKRSEGLFTCANCKGMKTTQFEMMVGRADSADMTTFVTCLTCGHRWKFS